MGNNLPFINAQTYRQRLSEACLESVTIVCVYDHLDEAVNVYNSDFQMPVEKICLIDWNTHHIEKYKNYLVENINDNLKVNNLAIFVHDPFWPTPYTLWLFRNPFLIYYYYKDMGSSTNNHYIIQPTCGYLNNPRLSIAYSLLSDNESQERYLEKALVWETGKCDYIKYDDEVEYFPRKLMPLIKKGDFCFNAGISSGYLDDVFRMSEFAGKTGKVFCFEPEPNGFHQASQTINSLKKIDNIVMLELGLWSKPDKLKVSNCASASSVVFGFQERNTEVDVTSLDDFVEKNHIQKVDFIKMDIEGAEEEALKGCKKVIKKFKPNMAICVYHAPSHLYDLLLYINSIDPNYNFYLYHHSPYIHETCLYAVHRGESDVE